MRIRVLLACSAETPGSNVELRPVVPAFEIISPPASPPNSSELLGFVAGWMSGILVDYWIDPFIEGIRSVGPIRTNSM